MVRLDISLELKMVLDNLLIEHVQVAPPSHYASSSAPVPSSSPTNKYSFCSII
jgi:hypothetical protein